MPNPEQLQPQELSKEIIRTLDERAANRNATKDNNKFIFSKINEGADLSYQAEDNGDTILHRAFRNRKISLISELLKLENVKDNLRTLVAMENHERKTPLDLMNEWKGYQRTDIPKKIGEILSKPDVQRSEAPAPGESPAEAARLAATQADAQRVAASIQASDDTVQGILDKICGDAELAAKHTNKCNELKQAVKTLNKNVGANDPATQHITEGHLKQALQAVLAVVEAEGENKKQAVQSFNDTMKTLENVSDIRWKKFASAVLAFVGAVLGVGAALAAPIAAPIAVAAGVASLACFSASAGFFATRKHREQPLPQAEVLVRAITSTPA